jgi:Skp family chaperone for outer membrane proteins
MTKVLFLGVGALAAFASISVAQAQPAPAAAPGGAAPAAAAAAAPPIPHGPPVPGVCMIAVDQAISGSTVGRFVGTRMDQIVAQVRAELAPEETAINTEGRAIEAARQTMDQAALQSRVANLNLRISNYQKKADQRQKEIQATEQKAITRIGQELDPVVRTVYQTAHCSLLLNRDAVMIGNPAMDITGQAVAGLNIRIQQFQFDREHLDTPAGGPPAAPR